MWAKAGNDLTPAWEVRMTRKSWPCGDWDVLPKEYLEINFTKNFCRFSLVRASYLLFSHQFRMGLRSGKML
jgi:hypothetical protein